MAYSSKILAQLITKSCLKNNITNIVISPGSRNAPLIISFTNHPEFKCYSIVDERSAAFFALGIAQQTQEPVLIFCTSGSALLNYYPAIAEAFYSNIPLIVLSADRPANKIDIADGQTIRQENVFKNHSLYNANLIDDDTKLDFNISEIYYALKYCQEKNGPVHINMPFEEPLYDLIDLKDYIDFKQINLPKINLPLLPNKFGLALNDWNKASKKMILVGVHQPDANLNKLLADLSEDPTLIILTETTSNLYHDNFINTIDNLIFSLTDEALEALKPDCLITFGGMVVSKRIKQFLRKYKPSNHWHISKLNAPDTYFCLTGQVALSDREFFKELISKKKNTIGHFKQDWLMRKDKVERIHNKFITSSPYSDLRVFKELIKSLPQHIMLQLANSSIIRYSQLFHIEKSIKVFCNRGTSGIDGSMSTAIGAAVALEKDCVFITGDLSFFYDSNALWNNYIPKNFKIIVINNGGGGIFRILPGPQKTEALNYFEAPHQLTAEHLCNMYGFDYTVVNNLDGLISCLPVFFSNEKHLKLLEIKTPKELNDKVLKDYFKLLS